MTCAKSNHCRHGLTQICCWCGEASHGPFMPSTLPSYTSYTCVTCGAYVFGSVFHYCVGGTTIYNGSSKT